MPSKAEETGGELMKSTKNKFVEKINEKEGNKSKYFKLNATRA